MTTISDLYGFVEAFDLRAEVREIMEESAEDLISLNQSQMYRESVDSFGRQILPEYYFEEYRQEKIKLNPGLGGLVDLNYTGAFYAGFYVDYTDDEYLIDSNDEKRDDLASKYGSQIFGLTPDSVEIFTDNIFRPELKDRIEANLGLKME